VETFTYDAMGRLSSGGATYGPAGELQTFNGVTRLYNALGQLTRMTKAGVMDMEYRYTVGQNNGRIAQSKDHVTGEEVTYQYDALNRLTAASTTDTAWGNAYTYDGWGNLTGKSVTKGTAPSFSQAYDPAMNLPVGTNWSTYAAQWDEDDRPIQGKAEVERGIAGNLYNGTVTYEPSGKRVFWRGIGDGALGWPELCEMTFYGITGQRLARYRCKYDEIEPGVYRFGVSVIDRTQHIGGQLTTETGKGVTTDRLGSVRARDGERYTYFPYGEPRTATVAESGMYAGLESPVRKYDAGNGRFSTPDPLGLGAVKLGDPGSWNRFAYVQGDPVNFRDPQGLYRCSVVTTITGLPEEHTLAEVYCESDGHTAWSYTYVTPYHGSAQALLNTFQAHGEQLDYIEQRRTLFEAIERLKRAFDESEDCRDLFGELDPKYVLDEMYNGTLFGEFKFGVLGGGVDGETQGRKGTYNGSGKYFAVDVTLQKRTDGTKYWLGSAATVDDRARILVHELGHVYNLGAWANAGSKFITEQNMADQATNKGYERLCIP
jgi:RHS repeat-associated protein